MNDYTQEILDSTHLVRKNSKHVKIDTQKITHFCESMPPLKPRSNWLKESPFPVAELNDKDKIHLMLTFNTLSFSYWKDPYWQVTYKGVTYQRGSWSLLASLFRAREEGIDILNPAVQATTSKTELEHILRGNTTIPLLEQRLAILNQVGMVIKERYDNDFKNVIYQTKADAESLLATIIRLFPLFEDKARYKGNEVLFYKRAQALVQSINSIEGMHLQNAEKLTALADYILPKKLRDAGILMYSPELASKIDHAKLIGSKSQYEVEIRANTIWAVEEIKNALATAGIEKSSQEINDYLWLTGDTVTSEYHRTRTTDY